jgi:hypothetical protein
MNIKGVFWKYELLICAYHGRGRTLIRQEIHQCWRGAAELNECGRCLFEKLGSSLSVIDRVSHPYKTKCKIVVSYNLIFKFLEKTGIENILN